MKIIIQRVSSASVKIEGEIVGEIGPGYLVLVGVTHGDTAADAARLAAKTVSLRIHKDDEGRMNRSIEDIGGAMLIISQFTLYADLRKGNRPSFVGAADPDVAEAVYDAYIAECRAALGPERVATGQFGAMMDVALVNHGPVTITLTTDQD